MGIPHQAISLVEPVLMDLNILNLTIRLRARDFYEVIVDEAEINVINGFQ